MSNASNNKFPCGGTFGDADALTFDGSDNQEDFAQDSAGIPSVNQGEKTNLDMGLGSNLYPRQTGSDSLTDEEAQLT